MEIYDFWPPGGFKMVDHGKIYAQNHGKIWNLATLHTEVGNPVTWNTCQVLLCNVIDKENQIFIARFAFIWVKLLEMLKMSHKFMKNEESGNPV